MQRTIVVKTRGMQLVEAREGRDIEELLRDLYERQGLTQEQIAQRLGVRRATVVDWMAALGIAARYLGSRKAAVA